MWTFAGYASDQVLGVRFGQDSFAVFIAESVPRHQADRILSELSAERPWGRASSRMRILLSSQRR